MNQLDLKGRGAIVTGGAAGIGLAIAERLAHSGAQLTLWDRDERAMQEANKIIAGGAHAVAVDVSDPASVEKAFAKTLERMPQVDILVCSAGITGPNTTVAQYPVDAWKQVLDVNLTGVFLCNKAVVAHMEKNDYGRIVNIASVAGKEGNPNASAYSASKAGVIALTKSLGKELAGYDSAVNCITPAAAKTRIFEQMTEEHIQFMLSKIPRNRFLLVDEVASMVAWLVSQENSFTTGAVFDLSGGRATY